MSMEASSKIVYFMTPWARFYVLESDRGENELLF